jgi:hypothetical protein
VKSIKESSSRKFLSLVAIRGKVEEVMEDYPHDFY